MNTSYQVGSALGLAVIVAIAAAITKSSLATGANDAVALNNGFRLTFLCAALLSAVAIVVAVVKIRKPG